MFNGELQAGDHRLEFGDATYIMGVINLSPESRNAHTIADTPDEAVALAGRYQEWGADLIEVGGQSSHYESPTLAVEDELARVVPAVERLAAGGHVVAVDTWKPDVARAAIEAGAAIVNDTGGLRSPGMRSVLQETNVAVVAVHVEGDDPHQVEEISIRPDKAVHIADSFQLLLDELDPSFAARVMVDPGIAINYRGDYGAYTRLQLEVIRQSEAFVRLNRPLVIPIPRKADIHWVASYVTLALEHGADVIRVHDVAVAATLARLWERVVAR